MTREEVKDLLKFIIRKCDLIINNKNYTADEYTQDKVEDIAEICHRVLDGQFGEIVPIHIEIFNADKVKQDEYFLYNHRIIGIDSETNEIVLSCD